MKKLLLLLIIPLLSFGQVFIDEFDYWEGDTTMLFSSSNNFPYYPCLEDSILLIDRWDIPDSLYTDSVKYWDYVDFFKKIDKETLSKKCGFPKRIVIFNNQYLGLAELEGLYLSKDEVEFGGSSDYLIYKPTFNSIGNVSLSSQMFGTNIFSKTYKTQEYFFLDEEQIDQWKTPDGKDYDFSQHSRDEDLNIYGGIEGVHIYPMFFSISNMPVFLLYFDTGVCGERYIYFLIFNGNEYYLTEYLNQKDLDIPTLH